MRWGHHLCRCWGATSGVAQEQSRKQYGLKWVLGPALDLTPPIGPVKSSQIHMSGNATNQELAEDFCNLSEEIALDLPVLKIDPDAVLEFWKQTDGCRLKIFRSHS
jgi:hypothetical protein